MAAIGRRVAATAVLLALLSGCAQPVRLSGPQVAFWAGRMALRVEADQAQSFSAAFELKGDAQAGELSLFSPLGATIAQMAWKPGEARLRSDGKELHFGSLDALTRHATGTELPVAGMFQWLAGENAVIAGWQADLHELGTGRLVARRSLPPPAVEIRLVLD